MNIRDLCSGCWPRSELMNELGVKFFDPNFFSKKLENQHLKCAIRMCKLLLLHFSGLQGHGDEQA